MHVRRENLTRADLCWSVTIFRPSFKEVVSNGIVVTRAAFGRLASLSTTQTISFLLFTLWSGCLVGQQYRLVKPIGFGTFGEIHRGIDIITKRDVAVKLERFQSRHQQLSNERRVYEVLRGGEGVPKVHWFGVEELDRIEYNVMVMDLLGPSLEDLFLFCSKKFTMKTVLMLADQMIDRIEFMHSKWFIHRDIKPNNFLMGVSGRCGLLSLVDLGLAKKYKESDSQVD